MLAREGGGRQSVMMSTLVAGERSVGRPAGPAVIVLFIKTTSGESDDDVRVHTARCMPGQGLDVRGGRMLP